MTRASESQAITEYPKTLTPITTIESRTFGDWYDHPLNKLIGGNVFG